MNSTFLKVFAFIWCGAYSAVAGTLYASFQQYVSPELYTSAYSFSFVSMLVFGGIGSVPGAVLGATALTVLMELLRFMKQWYLVIYAAAIIVIIVYEPYGLMGILTRMRTKRLAAAELSEGARDASL